MTKSRVLLVLGFLQPALLFSRPAVAEPPTPAECGEAFTQAQRLAHAGKQLAALDQLIICAQPSCPQFLTLECTSMFERVKLGLPTVTLVARDGGGAPLVDVSVSLDGKLLAERIEGRAFPVDPGLHKFVFERAGEVPVTVRTLVSEGEKNKPIVAEFAPKEVEVPAPPAASPSAPTPPREGGLGVPTATYVLGGLGIVAVAVGATFRLSGASDYNSLTSDCARSCTEAQVDPVRTKYTLSTVGFGVGAAALVAAGVVFMVGRGNSRPIPTSAGVLALDLRPDVIRGGGGGVLEGRF